MVKHATPARLYKLTSCLFILGVCLLATSTARGQSVYGTVVNSSVWQNDETFTPEHWHVSPGLGSVVDGEGRIMVALFYAGIDTLPLVDNQMLAPTNATTLVNLVSVQGNSWQYQLGGGLAPGSYRVIAWVDGNGNLLPDTGEPMGTRNVRVSENSSVHDIVVEIKDSTEPVSPEYEFEDWWEWHWFETLSQTRQTDFDNDGLTDGEEYALIHTHSVFVEPDNWDTDGDDCDDAWELFYDLDPTLNAADDGRFGDEDGDGIINVDEYMGPDGIGWRKDDNGDGIAEYTTSRDAMHPKSADSDKDGAGDANEFLWDLTHPTHSMNSTNFYPRSLQMSVGGTNGVDITDPTGDTYAFRNNGGTVEFWVRPGADGDGIIYSFTNITVGIPHFRISLENYRPRMDILNGTNIMATVGGVSPVGSVQQLESNTWTHVACVIAPQNNSLDLYVDGVLLIAQKTFIKPDFVRGNPTICREFDDGHLDELRVWSYPRPTADIEYWSRRIYPAPGYPQEWALTVNGRIVQMHDYLNPRPLIGYFRFDDGGPQVENFAFINYDLYPNPVSYYLGSNVVVGVTTDQAAPITGSDDADGDGLPEWWVEIHNLENYHEYYSTVHGPKRVPCPDDPELTEGFEYFRAFIGYASIGTDKAWIDGPGSDKFYTPKTRPDFYCGDRSSYTRYVYLFSQPIECPLNIYTPGMESTIIYVNGIRVTTAGDEANTIQSYDVTQYLQLGRNQIHVECISTVERLHYNKTTGIIGSLPYTVADYQAYDSSVPDWPYGCDGIEYKFRRAVGKFDADLTCNGAPMIVRGDESRADPRAVWHCQVWSEFYERIDATPIPDRENRSVPDNHDYGVPLNAERDNNPLDPDSADDNLDAVYEFISGTNPRDRDSNNNGVGDGDEDFDLDGLVNREEQRFGSDPWLPDSDDDGLIDGADVGAAGHPAQSLSPQNNLSVHFGGTDSDFVDFPMQQRFALSKWTIEAWVRPDADELDGGIIMQRSVSSNGVNYEVGLTAANLPYARYVSIGGAEVRVDGPAAVPADGSTWTHLAASYYDRDLVLYVNGTNVASTTGAAFPALYAGGPLTQHIGRGFKGCIDELRLWGEERTPEEIVLKRDEVLTGLEDTLTAYYRFDDSTSYSTNPPTLVGTSANNGTNGTAATVPWTWGQVEDNVLRYAADWQHQWNHSASFNGGVTFSTNHIIVGPPRLQVFLERDDAVEAGAAWSHNGGAAWNDSGYLETRLSPGDYEIGFKDVDGWVSPDAIDVTLVRGESTIVTGVYRQTASLTVIINNNDLVKTHATWSIDGGINSYGTGTRLDGLTPGASGYDIIFSDISSDVPDWDPPTTIHVELLEAEERTVPAEYTPVSGGLQITFLAEGGPTDPPNGARWRVSGNSNWFGSGEIVTNLNYGEHTVEYNTVEWWEAPGDEIIDIEDSTLLAVERVWTKLSEPTRIGAILTPSNVVVAGAQWQMGGLSYNSGENVVVDPGTYVLSFDDVDGYLTPLDMSVTADGASVTATGAYYRADMLGDMGTGAAGALLNPRGLAVGGANIYVADSDNHQIQIYDRSIEAWRILGSGGTAPGQFYQPFAVTVDGDGNLWVADTGNHRIQRQNAATGAWTLWGAHGAGVGQFNAPYDVVVDASGNAYVADYHNSRVQKRTSADVWSVLISAGSAAGKVWYPGALHLGSDGMLYVSDYNPASGFVRIQKFTQAGVYQATLGSSLVADGALGRPFGTTLMADGTLLVADSGQDGVPQRSAVGDWSYFINAGVLKDPQDITRDSWGNVFIADTGNGRILYLPAPDTDGDGIPDASEAGYGTLVSNPDTDGDGIPDGNEVLGGSDPLYNGSTFLYPLSSEGSVAAPGLTFNWAASPSSPGYMLWINRNGSKYDSRWVDGVTSWATEWTFPSGKYQWWIRGGDSTAWKTPWSRGVMFDIAAYAPSQTQLIGPSGIINTTDTPTFSWANAGGTWYQLWLNRNSTTYTSVWVNAALTYVPPSALAPGNYNWWGRAWNSDGFGAWSGASSFALGRAIPLTPSGLTTPTPTLSWQGAPFITWYHIWMNKDGAPYSDFWVNGATNWTPGSPLPTGTYRYWVQTWNPNGLGPWSTDLSFTVP